jgi:uncharacterized membrane protein
VTCLNNNCFNSRTADERDFILYDNYIDNSNFDHILPLPPNRASKYNILDNHGTRLIELCIASNLQNVNCRLHRVKSI